MERKPFAITLDPTSSLANHTGNWRTMRPIYLDHLPPCNQGCPAGENIQGWLYEAEEGKYEEAWRKIMEENPFPAIHGRVCYHPCETVCNRGQLDEAVSIHSVERFLGDHAIEQGWQIEAGKATGKRVLIIGAGPSGLSAAYHLSRMGHAVTIYEAGPKLGGMMRFGIPQYRLPRNIVDAEIARIEAMGVSIHMNRKVENLEMAIKEGIFNAVFLAIGAHLSKRVDIPSPDTGRIVDALGLLKGMEGKEVPKIGRRVVVYGGGDTAIDAARTAKRLGAEETLLIYRRDREHMPAHDSEVKEALEEGVLTRWLSMIRQVDENVITVEEMKLDEKGYPQPTGRMETLEADTVILAVGQEVDTRFLQDVPGLEISTDGVIQVDDTMMTGRLGVFAGGDMVPAERSVTVATGHGKKAARHIDAYLQGFHYAKPPSNSVAIFDRLNTWYYTDADQSHQPYLDLARRRASFEEVVGGLDASTALLEARRCLSCGNCFECDTCYGVCPDNAIIKLGSGKRYEINLEYCKGCGMCAEECPSGAIDMIKEIR